MGGEHSTAYTFILEVDKQTPSIETLYLPYRIQRIFAFKRRAQKVTGINSGVVLTDRLVKNMEEILDAFAALPHSPLDQVLIVLRDIRGISWHTPVSVIWGWPEPTREEFIKRDHFTEGVRGILHQAVCAVFDEMQQGNGDPLSFEVYAMRSESLSTGKEEYIVTLKWDQTLTL
jgi:hypothetical protein